MSTEVLERAAQPPESKPMSADQTFKSEFLRTMQERGYIHQITHRPSSTKPPPTGRSRPTSASTLRPLRSTSAT